MAQIPMHWAAMSSSGWIRRPVNGAMVTSQLRRWSYSYHMAGMSTVKVRREVEAGRCSGMFYDTTSSEHGAWITVLEFILSLGRRGAAPMVYTPIVFNAHVRAFGLPHSRWLPHSARSRLSNPCKSVVLPSTHICSTTLSIPQWWQHRKTAATPKEAMHSR